MINLPTPLAKVMQSEDLAGLKPFAVLLRNKWYATEESASGIEESDSGSDTGGYFALDTENPIDISGMIVKPNTLSMTLDVNEVAQYKANNVTLTIYDPFNRFIEGTPISFFPQGYQLYGSQVILYYGLDNNNKTPLFVGVIKDLPTHKPESYQVDLKLISPLELLNDIEAKDFSDKYEGETLTLHGQDDDNNPIYQTAHTGVGGFSAIYADGVKMFEGVDYQLSQLNELNLPALVTVINTDLHSATITADYYCWKTGLTVEQIVEGLVALGGYSSNTDIRSVVWNTEVKNQIIVDDIFAGIGYYENPTTPKEYLFNWLSSNSSWGSAEGTAQMINSLPKYFDFNFDLYILHTTNRHRSSSFCIGDQYNASSRVLNGFDFYYDYGDNYGQIYFRFYQIVNGTRNLILQVQARLIDTIMVVKTNIQKRNGQINIHFDISYPRSGPSVYDFSFPISEGSNFNFLYQYYGGGSDNTRFRVDNMVWNLYDDNLNSLVYGISKPCIITEVLDKGDEGMWGEIIASLENNIQANYFLNAYFSEDKQNWSEPISIDLNTPLGKNERYMFYVLGIESSPSFYFDLKYLRAYYYASSLIIQFVNLSGKTVLEALQDFALISGYEFGVDRQGVFFFKPRNQTTTPIYDLDKNEIVKIDNVQKRFNDFFTKLTLTFAERPLEFYANTGERPTPIDKYGVINKEINKPDIVSYDNPELAQAIGPQLLAIYSNLADIIQLTGKLNLNLELGDVVNVKRNYNLTVPNNASDVTKFNAQDTYFRACKITGLNYNFAKKQITYTLRDVSNETNKPQYQFDEFIYDFQVPLGVKE